ncbi:hypothetical protein NQ315_006190 [Exocentrus adspersus]|uniref:Uncharacterized protein n=1 Tax=Exocentrus adspersus TaxID=1586481 RepID=A0AAV8W0B6_9CUCU|nr:hypothetical protein NQ315_006190 [Exocentrus adspersus]
MSTSSEVNLKQTLRKIEYPLCAKEALNKVVELVCSRITSIKHMDLALDLMSEFIFYEVDRRGNKRSQGLTPLLELQLIEILFEYFNSIPNESIRNTVFLSLFSGTTAAMRLGILSKLVSVGMGIPSQTILMMASVWMQQLGSFSQNSCKLAESLVQDYFYFSPESTERLKSLPSMCPQFTANFMTAISENYFSMSRREVSCPPKNLLEILKYWISNNYSLCIAAQQRPAVLPPGAIAMEPTTPIAGLLKWCILAPIYKQDINLYSELHLALLNSILEIPRTNPPKAIYAQHLAHSINPILAYVNDLKNKQELKLDKILNEDALQLSLDRYAQAVQVAHSVNAIYGHVDDLFNQLKQLPFNKLLSIVISTYNRNKVIVL